MRKYYFVALLLPLVFYSCKTKTHSPGVSACGVKDPVNNLPWLKQKVDDAKSAGTAGKINIKKCENKGKGYFFYSWASITLTQLLIFDSLL